MASAFCRSSFSMPIVSMPFSVSCSWSASLTPVYANIRSDAAPLAYDLHSLTCELRHSASLQVLDGTGTYRGHGWVAQQVHANTHNPQPTVVRKPQLNPSCLVGANLVENVERSLALSK